MEQINKVQKRKGKLIIDGRQVSAVDKISRHTEKKLVCLFLTLPQIKSLSVDGNKQASTVYKECV